MNRYGRSILCTAALFVMASSLARAADPDWIAPDQRVEIPPMTAPACDAGPSSAGVPLAVFVPNLTPGFEFSAGLLILQAAFSPAAEQTKPLTITDGTKVETSVM